MITIYSVAAFWFLSALLSTIIANRLKISNALMEIIIGAIIGFIAYRANMIDKLSLDADCMKFSCWSRCYYANIPCRVRTKSRFTEIKILGNHHCRSGWFLSYY